MKSQASQAIHVCILGGGFGGLYTALYFSRFAWVRSQKCRITLVEPNERFLFSPLLYELITGELKPWEIAPSYQKLLRGKPITFCQQAVVELDLPTRQVKLDNGAELIYDYLVLAVGRQNRWANIEGIQTHALPFRSLADMMLLEEKLQRLEASDRQQLRLAIVGGGPSGVELACKLADRLGKRVQVRLIERGDAILKNFSTGVQKAAYRALQKRKIAIDFQTDVSAIEAESLTILQGNQTTILPVDLVMWTAGTQTRDWVKHLDCQKNDFGKLITRPTLQLVERSEVFALGDLADIPMVPATAQAAYQQASCAAKNLQAIVQGKPLKRFRYLHLGDMLTLGKGAAIVSSFFINIEGRLAASIRRLVYVQRLPTMRHRLQVLKNLFLSIFK
jgi:demethylphylloquinone reductase